MKNNLKTFEQFVNESYNIDEGKVFTLISGTEFLTGSDDGETTKELKDALKFKDIKAATKAAREFDRKGIPNMVHVMNEMASFAGRAWSGKIENLDNLFSWMYDKDILNKGEKAKKDSIFHQYYRYYNDGDFPRGLSKAKDISRYDSEEKIGKALEEYIEDFMKEILGKYAGKYDRRKFHFDQLLSQLYTLQRNIKFKVPEGQDDNGRTESFSYDVHSFLYFYKKLGKVDPEFDKLVIDLERAFKSFSDTANKQIEAKLKKDPDLGGWGGLSTNKIFAVKKLDMEKAGIWTAKNQKDYDVIVSNMNRLHEIISDVIEATNKAKIALNESYGNGMRDKDLTYFEVSSDKGTILSFYKESGKWYEDKVIQGKKPYGFGSKSYGGYLNPSEVADWLRGDYKEGHWDVVMAE